MAEAMTYNSLVQDVKDYAERDDEPFLTQIPRFIMLAENRMAMEVRGLGYLRIVTSNLISGNPALIKPTRWRETAGIHITINGSESFFIKQRAHSYLKVYWPNVDLEAQPEFYSDYGYEHFFFAPTPDQAYPVTIAYFERPTPLSSSDQTSWTTQYFPQGLLFATLMEAQPFLKRPERTAEFQALYDRAVAAYQQEIGRRLQGDQVLARNSA